MDDLELFFKFQKMTTDHLLCAQLARGERVCAFIDSLLAQGGNSLLDRMYAEIHQCQDCAQRYRQDGSEVFQKRPDIERARLLYAITKIPTSKEAIPADPLALHTVYRTIQDTWECPLVLRAFPKVEELFTQSFIAFARSTASMLLPSISSTSGASWGSKASVVLYPLHRNILARTWGRRGIACLHQSRNFEPLVDASLIQDMGVLWTDISLWLQFHLLQILNPDANRNAPEGTFPITPVGSNFLAGFLDIEKTFAPGVWNVISEQSPGVIELLLQFYYQSGVPDVKPWRPCVFRIFCDLGADFWRACTSVNADPLMEEFFAGSSLEMLTMTDLSHLLETLARTNLLTELPREKAHTIVEGMYGFLKASPERKELMVTFSTVVGQLAANDLASGRCPEPWIRICPREFFQPHPAPIASLETKQFSLQKVLLRDLVEITRTYLTIHRFLREKNDEEEEQVPDVTVSVCDSLWNLFLQDDFNPGIEACTTIINTYAVLTSIDRSLLSAATQRNEIAQSSLLSVVNKIVLIIDSVWAFVHRFNTTRGSEEELRAVLLSEKDTADDDSKSSALVGFLSMMVSPQKEFRTEAFDVFTRFGCESQPDRVLFCLREFPNTTLRSLFAIIERMFATKRNGDWEMKLACRITYLAGDAAICMFSDPSPSGPLKTAPLLDSIPETMRVELLQQYFLFCWQLFMGIIQFSMEKLWAGRMLNGVTMAVLKAITASTQLVDTYSTSNALKPVLMQTRALRKSGAEFLFLFARTSVWFSPLLETLENPKYKEAIVRLLCSCLRAMDKVEVSPAEKCVQGLKDVVSDPLFSPELKKLLMDTILASSNNKLLTGLGEEFLRKHEQELPDEELMDMIWGDMTVQSMEEIITVIDSAASAPVLPKQEIHADNGKVVVSKPVPSAAPRGRLQEILTKKKPAAGAINKMKVRDSSSSSESDSEEKYSAPGVGFGYLLDDCHSPMKEANGSMGSKANLGTRSVQVIQPQVSARKVVNVQQKNDAQAALVPNIDALYSSILGWKYWKLAENHVVPKVSIPGTFKGMQQYWQVFEPLLLAEAAAQILKSFEEVSEDTIFKGSIMTVANVDKFHDILLAVNTSQEGFQGLTELDLIAFAPWDATKEYRALELSRDPTVALDADKQHPVVFAKVNSVQSRNADIAQVSVRICLENYVKLLSHLRIGTAWMAVKIGSLSTVAREYQAIRGLAHYILRDEILNNKRFQRRKVKDTNFIRSIQTSFRLNEPQAVAVATVLKNKEGFILIQGPPGTGKTKTILGCIGALLSEQGTLITLPNASKAPQYAKHILVCAPSNAAVDELVRRARRGVFDMNGARFYPKIVRIGTTDGVSESVKELTLDQCVDTAITDDAELISLLKSRKNPDIDKMLDRLSVIKTDLKKKYAELDANQQDTHLENEIRLMVQERKELMEMFTKECQAKDATRRALDSVRNGLRAKILNEANIVLCTLSLSGHESLARDLTHGFETVIVDEACQSIELSALIPLKYGTKRCVLVGDPNQLPPTVLSMDAQKFDYEQSLFVRLQKNQPGSVLLLSIQYRMHPEISQFPSLVFYESKLKDGREQDTLTAPWHLHAKGYFPPYCFFDIRSGREDVSGQSLFNNEEVTAVLQLFDRLCVEYPHLAFAGKIGIITPYKEQKRALMRQFVNRYQREILQCVEINTIDGFQGQEKDIVIMSCVRANAKKAIGFLSDVRRLNVGLTRARHSLWIMGHANSLVSNDCWKQLIENAKERNVYREVRLPLYDHKFSGTRPKNALAWSDEGLPPPPRVQAATSKPEVVKEQVHISPIDAPARNSPVDAKRPSSASRVTTTPTSKKAKLTAIALEDKMNMSLQEILSEDKDDAILRDRSPPRPPATSATTAGNTGNHRPVSQSPSVFDRLTITRSTSSMEKKEPTIRAHLSSGGNSRSLSVTTFDRPAEDRKWKESPAAQHGGKQIRERSRSPPPPPPAPSKTISVRVSSMESPNEASSKKTVTLEPGDNITIAYKNPLFDGNGPPPPARRPRSPSDYEQRRRPPISSARMICYECDARNLPSRHWPEECHYLRRRRPISRDRSQSPPPPARPRRR